MAGPEGRADGASGQMQLLEGLVSEASRSNSALQAPSRLT